ncbi:DUF4272 domain-containing protein [Phototrophicus methaneseepsis]|uniref:DUF4272 domain-containing protein n=1 Tax=Phototrophicus methaneseepsis TaxID=2710758 RepID=A0A7S8IEM0_9CHLR|nr:DUF4272 domain-containing protein [Phototrophicus methaneseepsis]QPC82726.1 DUF4272 domain-containing protein [Phototrophicus methaneseepsis]
MDEPRIQNARAVAYRALCLGAILKRGEFEITLQGLDDDYALPEDARRHMTSKHHDLNDQLYKWVDDENLTQYLIDTERTLLQKPLGSWRERTIISMSWRVESLGVMLWALRYLDSIPPFDVQFEPDDVLYPLDVLTPTVDFVWRAQLRPARTLIQMRDRAEGWNWRARATELERLGVQPPNGVPFREIIHETAHKARDKGHVPYLIDNDFPAFGKPFAELDSEQYALVSNIAYERYTALSWLCELSAAWEGIRIDR